MSEGDIAILAFQGDTVPSALDLVLISQSDPGDIHLHSALRGLFEKKSMIAVTADQLAKIANQPDFSTDHPIRIVAADDAYATALEDAAFSGPGGTLRLLQRSGQKVVSAEALAKAKANADAIGRDGEGLVNVFLGDQVKAGILASAIWVSAENAISPYDFEITLPTGKIIYIDVKSTTGPFDNVIHISMAELLQASTSCSYLLYRIYNLNADGAMLRPSENIHKMASALVAAQQDALPPGFRPDSFSATTAAFSWQTPVFLSRPIE